MGSKGHMLLKRSLILPSILLSFTMAEMSVPPNATQYRGVHSVAYVTTPSEEVAKKLAHGLITEKLAACVNILPKVTSVYFWEGEVNEDNEAMMIIKTKTNKVDELTEYVKKNHPYTVCEVISIKIENGNEPYLKWITDNVS